MRVIIEVDSPEELQEALTLLGERPVEVRQRTTPRQERLEQIFRKYHGRLPEDYHFDREAAHER